MLLRGIFLTSGQPERLAVFYRDVIGLPLETIGSQGTYQYWKIDDGRIQLAIHDAGAFADYTSPALAGSNLTHLYFQIPDQRAFLEMLQSHDIEPHAIDDIVVTIVDPDGRKVMFGTA